MATPEPSEPLPDNNCLHLRGVTMAPYVFRQCVFIIDELVSCYECFQFMVPVPPTAVVYHREISKPMDFMTLEANLYANKYLSFREFAADLCLIWKNATRFHRTVDPIYQQADALKLRFEKLVEFMNGGPRPHIISTSVPDRETVVKTSLPEERAILKDSNSNSKENNSNDDADDNDQDDDDDDDADDDDDSDNNDHAKKNTTHTPKTNLYLVQAVSDKDASTRKLRGYANVRYVFQYLNSAFFRYMTATPKQRETLPLPRLYIAKNRTLINQARTDEKGILAVMFNVQLSPKKGDNSETYQLEASVVLAEPMNETHYFDDTGMDQSQKYEYTPKAWLKLKVLKIVHHVETTANEDVVRSYLRKVYTTFKLSAKHSPDPKKVHDREQAKRFALSILEPVASKPPSPALAALQIAIPEPTPFTLEPLILGAELPVDEGTQTFSREGSPTTFSGNSHGAHHQQAGSDGKSAAHDTLVTRSSRQSSHAPSPTPSDTSMTSSSTDKQQQQPLAKRTRKSSNASTSKNMIRIATVIGQTPGPKSPPFKTPPTSKRKKRRTKQFKGLTPKYVPDEDDESDEEEQEQEQVEEKALALPEPATVVIDLTSRSCSPVAMDLDVDEEMEEKEKEKESERENEKEKDKKKKTKKKKRRSDASLVEEERKRIVANDDDDESPEENDRPKKMARIRSTQSSPVVETRQSAPTIRLVVNHTNSKGQSEATAITAASVTAAATAATLEMKKRVNEDDLDDLEDEYDDDDDIEYDYQSDTTASYEYSDPEGGS